MSTNGPTIDSIEILRYRLPLDPPLHAAWDPQPRTAFDTTVVRVRAGDYQGVGAGDAMLGFAGHEALFIGQDPFAIQRHSQVLDNLQFHYGRMWPLEVALWDLMGQISGQPLWKLLGGASATVPLYASTGARMAQEERVASTKMLLDAGFKAIKLRLYEDDKVENVRLVHAVRRAVGDKMEILVDANQAWQMPWDTRAPWDLKMALWMADALAEVGVYWLEEPLHRHNYAGLAQLRRSAKIRIAGGEGNRTMAEQRAYLQRNALDVYQADVVWSTGIWQARQLALEVAASGAIFSPHTWGDGLVLLANLHLSAAVSNAPFIEFPFDPPTWTPERRDYILPSPLQPDADSTITLSDAPGLGIQLNWDALESWRVA